MKTRADLDKFFEDCVVKYVTSYDIKNIIAETCYRKYGMKILRCQMILSGGAAVREVSEVELFWILDSINTVVKNAHIILSDYFSKNKISEYSKAKYKEAEVGFPVKLDMIASGEDKWIGAIDAQTLVRWRNGGYLKYNKNIQRRVKTVLRGGKYVETIDLNLKSVNDMIPLFKERKFISNVLTFNLDESADFYYDPDEKVLVINSCQGFDMTDGYHRLVALEKVIEEDPGFNYLMEIRITCFSEEKANFFIWQEEQRTPMQKTSIKSYNMDDLANKITRKINESALCNLSGNIVRGGLIDFSTFSDCIDYYYIREMAKEKEKKVALVTVPREVIECINLITDDNPEILTWAFTKADILIMLFLFKKVGVSKELPVLFEKMIDFDYKEDKKILYGGSMKLVTNVLERVYSLVSGK